MLAQNCGVLVFFPAEEEIFLICKFSVFLNLDVIYCSKVSAFCNCLVVGFLRM